MSIPLSYLGVIVIWTTTPLAIKWSAEGTGFIFAVASRMALGALLALLLVALVRIEMPWHDHARKAYLVSGIGIFAAMLCVYWAAPYIPSGWISLLFGFSPILTGVLSALLLGERELTPVKLLGMLLGLAGLGLIFASSLELEAMAVVGILAVLLSTVIYSLTAVVIKRYNAGIPGLAVTAGGLLLALPLYAFAWFVIDGEYPAEIPSRAGLAILYLAVFGSVIGFALYFHVLKHISATRVSLITLITPVTALLLGRMLNDEPMTLKIAAGAALVLAGLLVFESAGWWRRRT